MSKTYGTVNYISSFGFTERWRRQCIREIDWDKVYNQGYDFMSGMGETWGIISKYSKTNHNLTAIDLSAVMNLKASTKSDRYSNLEINIEQQNILNNSIKSNSAEYIVSSFGLKTFSKEQLRILAKEIHRILKPEGQFSLIEISRPKNTLLILPYMFYLKYMIPWIGRLFMGNSTDYKMLGIYCEKFEDCTVFQSYLKAEGLQVEMKKYFFGCATGVTGSKGSSKQQ